MYHCRDVEVWPEPSHSLSAPPPGGFRDRRQIDLDALDTTAHPMNDRHGLTKLHRRLVRLEQCEAARTATQAYASAIDAADPDRTAELFAEDGVLHTPSGSPTGRSAIADFYRARITGIDRKHFVTNVSAQWIEEGRVAVHSYFLYTGREPAHSALGWGSYDDIVDLSGPQALFESKTITPDVFTDLAEGWSR